MNRLAMFGLVLLVCGGPTSLAFAEVVDASVCEVLADPSAFDGKFVRIKAATVIAGFDEFVVDGSGCSPAAAIWLAYPEGAKAKAGPAALVRLQVAKNGAAVSDAPKRTAVALQKNGDFERFDSLLARPYKSHATCLGCPRYTVAATLVGRLDGVSVSRVVRDKAGKAAGIDGFGNLSLYRARLVLQAVSDVVPSEIDYSAAGTPVRGDSRRAGSRLAADQVKRAIAAFGAEGEDNGVVVGFGVANEVPADEGARGGGDSPDGILFQVTFDMDRLGREMLRKGMTHVGTHIADVRGGVALRGPDQAELHAWQVTFSE